MKKARGGGEYNMEQWYWRREGGWIQYQKLKIIWMNRLKIKVKRRSLKNKVGYLIHLKYFYIKSSKQIVYK